MTERVALVTGGSRGIGLCCARWLAASGEKVAVTYKTAPPTGLEGPYKFPILALACDVSVPEQVESCFSKVESELGPVEVLICAAGITDDALLLRMDEDRWSKVIETDLTACYRVTRRAIAAMVKARAGRVVLISSVVAMLGNAGQTNYAAAKAGLIGFGRSLAREVASRSVTVNIVAPGLIATDMLQAIGEERLNAFTSQIPLGHLGSPEDVAAVVGFLASAEAGYVTGAVIPIDGGLGMGH